MYFDQCSIYAQILLVSGNFPSSLFFSVLRACLWPIIQPSCMLLLRGVRVPFKRLNLLEDVARESCSEASPTILQFSSDSRV